MLRTGLRVVEDEVAVGERSALGVLAREADRDAFDEQARECERLRLAPVDSARVERSHAPLEHLHELRIHGEPVGYANELLLELA